MTTKQPTFIDVPVYLLIEPRWKSGSFWKDDKDRPILESGRVVKATRQRPTVGKAGGVITKVTLRIDSAAFLPLQPEAVVVISPDNAEVIEVTADAPESEVRE